MFIKRPLRPYQVQALKYCKAVKNPALFMEMGLGKTIVAIRYCKSQFLGRNLIVAPYSAFNSWIEELHNEHEPPAVELIGSRKQRKALIYKDAKWFILNKEGHHSINQITEINWDIIILDESDFISRPPKTNKSRFGRRLNTTAFYLKHFRNVKYRMILTGTPGEENIMQYFTQLQFLDSEIFGFKSFYSWRSACFSQYGFKFIMKPKYKNQFIKILSERCFFLTRKNVDLHSEQITTVRKIKMKTNLLTVYKNFTETFILEYNGQTINQTKYSLVLFQYLKLLCSGFLDNKMVFDEKINELFYLLNGELSGKSVVVCCVRTIEIEYLKSKIKNSVAVYGKINQSERTSILCKFNNRKFKILIVNPACIQYGTDLSVSDTIIFFSLPLSSKSYLQIKGRLERGARKKSILNIYLIMKGSVEEDNYLGLKQKKSKDEILRMMIKRVSNK